MPCVHPFACILLSGRMLSPGACSAAAVVHRIPPIRNNRRGALAQLLRFLTGGHENAN